MKKRKKKKKVSNRFKGEQDERPQQPRPRPQPRPQPPTLRPRFIFFAIGCYDRPPSVLKQNSETLDIGSRLSEFN